MHFFIYDNELTFKNILSYTIYINLQRLNKSKNFYSNRICLRETEREWNEEMKEDISDFFIIFIRVIVLYSYKVCFRF